MKNFKNIFEHSPIRWASKHQLKMNETMLLSLHIFSIISGTLKKFLGNGNIMLTYTRSLPAHISVTIAEKLIFLLVKFEEGTQ